MITVRYSDNMEIEEDRMVYNDDDKLQRIKLILRPLSHMTKTEKHEIGMDEQEIKHLVSQGVRRSMQMGEVWWLLKKGFDLFDLIPSGQALDKHALLNSRR